MATEKTAKRNLRKELEGTVVGNKMNKTAIVSIPRRATHAKYGKIITTFTKVYAHDEKNEARIGDHVRIVETRPLSRLKRWRLVEITRKAGEASS